MSYLGALGAISQEYDGSSEEEEEGGGGEGVIIIKSEPINIQDDCERNDGGEVNIADVKRISEIVDKQEDTTMEEKYDLLIIKSDEENVLNPPEQNAFSTNSYLNFRDEIKIELESEDSQEDSAHSSEEEEYDLANHEVTKVRDPPRAKGELRYQDLPPIEDLHISVPREKTRPIGIIKSVVDPLVVIEAYPNTPALDIDSVLFLEEGERALGTIFDVLGQVKQPFYCVRFNSLEHISSRGVEKGMLVYCAPKTEHTSFVLLGQLQQLKGTDASWLNDIEPPPNVQEFSDDEEERAVKRKNKRHKRPKAVPVRNRVAQEQGAELGGPRFPRHFHRQPQFPQQRVPFYGGSPHPPEAYVSWHRHPMMYPTPPGLPYYPPPPPPPHYQYNQAYNYAPVNSWMVPPPPPPPLPPGTSSKPP